MIKKATYAGVDCTTLIQSKVVGGKLVITSNNDIVGDPAVGTVKYLDIEFEDGFQAQIREGDTLVYPKSNNRKLGIFYSNNNNHEIWPAIYKSLDTIKEASEGVADIVVCTWEHMPNVPFYQINSWYKSQSHLNQLLQIMQCLYKAKTMGNYEYVSFLEHDVMYPIGYFDYPDFSSGEVLTNMNYGVVCRSGWQKRKQNDEPFHQMTMRLDDAIEHCLSILPNALITNSGMIETQTLKRSQWNCENEAIHINHGVHFTSHNSIYDKDNLTEIHPYWGNVNNYKNLFMNKLKEIIMSYAISFNPTQEQKEIAEKRLEICASCEFWVQSPIRDYCDKCGCTTSAKVFSPVGAEACPMSKWTV